jgi:hypothetical protein
VIDDDSIATLRRTHHFPYPVGLSKQEVENSDVSNPAIRNPVQSSEHKPVFWNTHLLLSSGPAIDRNHALGHIEATFTYKINCTTLFWFGYHPTIGIIGWIKKTCQNFNSDISDTMHNCPIFLTVLLHSIIQWSRIRAYCALLYHWSSEPLNPIIR